MMWESIIEKDNMKYRKWVSKPEVKNDVARKRHNYHTHHLHKFPCDICNLSLLTPYLSPLAPGNHWRAFHPVASHSLVLYEWNHTRCILFCLASFSFNFEIHSSSCVSIKFLSFLYIAEEYSILWIYHNLFIHLLDILVSILGYYK